MQEKNLSNLNVIKLHFKSVFHRLAVEKWKMKMKIILVLKCLISHLKNLRSISLSFNTFD